MHRYRKMRVEGKDIAMYTYTGKTALITGASSGIGEVFAQELAKRGMDVILVARSEDTLRKLAAELTKQYSVRSEVIVSDLSQERASAQVKAEVEKRGLQVDLLVNNAGIGTYDAFEKLDPERDHQQVMLNVTAVVDLAHAFLQIGRASCREGVYVSEGSRS